MSGTWVHSGGPPSLAPGPIKIPSLPFIPKILPFLLLILLDQVHNTMAQTDVPIRDVLIIGAGPCGLTVAARLREPLPHTFFTESERSQFSFIKASRSRRTSRPTRTSRLSNTALNRLPYDPPILNHKLDMGILNASGDMWMST